MYVLFNIKQKMIGKNPPKKVLGRHLITRSSSVSKFVGGDEGCFSYASASLIVSYLF